MISTSAAERLVRAGLVWHPAAGDRFTLRSDELMGQLFTISDMVVEPHEYPTGTVLGFNGTTEWALDSVQQDDALWLPREDQLRDLLGEAFVALERIPGGEAPEGIAVIARVGAATQRYVDVAADAAYARALLDLLSR